MQAHFESLFQTKLKSFFKSFVGFLEDHHLDYFAAYGTLLGAVRHQDIIPWDDDIDIHMPRSSYNKLLLMYDELSRNGIRIDSISRYGYLHSYAKVYDMKTTVLESRHTHLVEGLWIDIFPIDYYPIAITSYPKEYEEYREAFAHYQKAIMPNKMRYLLSLVRYFKFADLKSFISKHYYSEKYAHFYYDRFVDIDRSVQNEKGEGCICYAINWWDRAVLDVRWFDEFVYQPFGDFKVRIPKGYDSYLKLMYRDYMKLPPIDKRVFTHHIYYTNLEESLSFSDVMKQIKLGGYKGKEYIHVNN